MIESTHSVERVGSTRSPGSDAGLCLCGSRIGMAKRYANTSRHCMSNQLLSARQFRCDGDEANVSVRCIHEAVECGGAWRKQMLGWMHSALFVRKKWTFEMDAKWPRSPRLRKLCDFIRNSIQCAQRLVHRRRNRSREVRGGSPRTDKSADLLER